jgi:hypothetical protein
VIPKNSRVYIKRIIKNVQPVKGGIITNTQKEQELKEIQMKKTHNALLTNTSSSTTTTTTTTTKTRDANGNEQTDPKPKAPLPTTTITNTNISNTVNIQISNYARTDEIALANAITQSINIEKFVRLNVYLPVFSEFCRVLSQLLQVFQVYCIPAYNPHVKILF